MAPPPPSSPTWPGAPVATGRAPDRAVRDLFAWLAPEYDVAVNGYTFGQDLRWKSELVARLDVPAGGRVLDLATGTGRIHDRLAVVVGSARVVGLDRSRSMLRARPAVDRRVVQANAERLPFPDRTFDAVTAGYLLKYVDLGVFARELARILRPGGRFAGYDFSRPRLRSPMGRLYAIYLHRVLPGLGATFGGRDAGWPAMMRFLGGLAERSRWEDRITGELERVGFERIELASSLGGAVTWVWASRGAGAGPRAPAGG